MRNIPTNQDERIQKSLFLFLFKDIFKLEKKAKKQKLTLDEILILIDKYMQLGQQTNDFTKALEITEEALKNNPNNVKLISIEAWIFKSQNKLKEAINLCKKAIEKDNTESELWRILGELYIEKKDFNNAEINCQKAIELDENNHYAHYDLALIYERNNKINKAIKELKIAIKTEIPDWKIIFHTHLYKIHKDINDIDNALHYLKKAIEFGNYNLVEDWEYLNLYKIQNDLKFNDIYYF